MEIALRNAMNRSIICLFLAGLSGLANNNEQLPNAPVDTTTVVPAGTWITVRVDQPLTTKRNLTGDEFALTLAQPLVANGVVLARRGQTLTGVVTQVQRAGRVKGQSHLGLALRELTLADGRTLPVRTELADFLGGGTAGRDAATVGITSGVGALIGAGAAGGAGAGLGAAAGAGASAIAVLLGRGRDVQIPEESLLRFRLSDPLPVDISQHRFAFQPVQQSDFESQPLQPRRVQQTVVYNDPWMWGGGWGPGFGWGPGLGWGGPRVFVGGGRGFGGRRR
jgi:hypothetical protein